MFMMSAKGRLFQDGDATSLPHVIACVRTTSENINGSRRLQATCIDYMQLPVYKPVPYKPQPDVDHGRDTITDRTLACV